MSSPPGDPPAPRGWRIEARRVDLEPDPEALFELLAAGGPHPFWLDTAAPGPGHRFSYLGAGDGPHAELITADATAGTVTVVAPGGEGATTRPGGLLDALGARLAAWRDRRPGAHGGPAGGPPFSLGYVGYLGYGLAGECGPALHHPAEPPDAALLLADRLVAVDHRRHATWILALSGPGDGSSAARYLDETARAVEACPTAPTGGSRAPAEAPWRPPDPLPLPVDMRHSPERYQELVGACREAIAAGDSYELCLTTTLTVPGAVDPRRAYHHLRRVSPAPYAALLGIGERWVLCSSPERFLRVDAGGTVESRPIKGTRPRSPDAPADARLAADLAASAKDRAENLMIVDLARSDLSRVCAPGSVEATRCFEIESFATVHQMVSTIRGRLAPGRTAVDAARAAFPPASMTGAPKTRSVEILDGLEGAPRGVYSGALGWFSLDGRADLAVTIRTVVVEDDRATLGVGGAVVWDSVPQAEWAEALVKAVPGVGALVLARSEERDGPGSGAVSQPPDTLGP